MLVTIGTKRVNAWSRDFLAFIGSPKDFFEVSKKGWNFLYYANIYVSGLQE